MTYILDTLKMYNMNAIIYHVRTHNDAFYKSELNPVSPYFESSEETVFSKAALKVSPVDLIVGTPYNPQVVEEGILPDIEH